MAAAALALAEELSRKTGLRCAAIAGDDAYAVEIVGGTRYQAALEELAGGRSSRGVQPPMHGSPRPGARQSRRGAVLVQISGHDVGYLGRDLGPVFTRELAAAGCSAAVAGAVIVGGWNRMGGDAGHFGVKLDLVQPLRFEGAVDQTAATQSPPPPTTSTATSPAKPSLWSSARLVADRLAGAAASFLAGIGMGRLALAGASFLAGVGMARLALAAAIFLAGVATGAGLIWLQPTPAPPAPIQSEAPPSPDAKAAAEGPIETAAPIAVPLPRPRPGASPDSTSTTGQ